MRNKKVFATDSYELLDEKTLRYLYHRIVILMVGNKNGEYAYDNDVVFINGKDRAYRNILGIISDILSN